MKRLAFVLLAAACLAPAEAATVNRDVLVPDEPTAIAIARAVLVPIVGKNFDTNRMRPLVHRPHAFHASLSGDTWVVEDAPPARKKWSDPILRVEIDRKRGCVLRISET
jgi:hypothetical protein